MKCILLFLDILRTVFLDLVTTLVNIFIWRDRKIWLFGAWFGEKFADNSRFIFQYLLANKDLYRVKKVVWVTRNDNVYRLLKQNGYPVLKMHSFLSFYYHFRAGVHIICNMDAKRQGISPDIMTCFSLWAKKINLWHGISPKATGYLQTKNKNSRVAFFYYRFICRFFKPGMWGMSYFLCTSKELAKANEIDRQILNGKMIISNYPRLYPCPHIFGEELSVLSLLKQRKKDGQYIILYTPTFRKNSNAFVDPLSDCDFVGFLEKNNFLWVTKQHMADSRASMHVQSKSVLVLEPNFEINLLYDFVDMSITDYSSTSSDALFHKLITLEYCPDYEHYLLEDRGFIIPFKSVHLFNPVDNIESLKREIIDKKDARLDEVKNYETVMTTLFGERPLSVLKDVFEDICKQAGIKI